MKTAQITFAAAATLLAGSAFAAGNALGEIPNYPAGVSDVAPAHQVVANAGSPQPLPNNIVGEVANYPGARDSRMAGPTNTVAARDIPDSIVGAVPDYPGQFPTAGTDGSRG